MKNLKIALISASVAALAFAQFAVAAPATNTAKNMMTAPAAKLATAEKMININTATAKEIAALPGIGHKKAKAIIAARPFKSPADLMKVKGIKQATFNKIKNSITI